MTDDRIAKLEATITAAQAELQAIKAGQPAPAPRPPRDEGVRIMQVLDERTDNLPDLKQMSRLFSIVKPHSPWPQTLINKFDEQKPFRAFASAFRWVQNVGRTERPNPKFALSYWTDTCRMWLRARNCVGSDLDANGLVLACLASGDVPYASANPSMGVVWELGLREYGGTPATDVWRTVLNGGVIRPPSAPASRGFVHVPSPVRIYGG
jgi:hypothetical protein